MQKTRRDKKDGCARGVTAAFCRDKNATAEKSVRLVHFPTTIVSIIQWDEWKNGHAIDAVSRHAKKQYDGILAQPFCNALRCITDLTGHLGGRSSNLLTWLKYKYVNVTYFTLTTI